MYKDFLSEVRIAKNRIKDFIRTTPLIYSAILSDKTGAEVYLKLENWQVTGSFKARGALNKVLQIENIAETTVVAASTGNHAAAVSYALAQIKCDGVIFLPENVSKVKVDKLKGFRNVSLEYFGNDSIEAETKARTWAIDNGYTYVSPYNDADIIAGQGTIGLEIAEQLGTDSPYSVFVPVGGGGLISGIAGYLKMNEGDVEVVGCQPENSCVMYKSVKNGKIMDIPSLPTISDGTAGGVEENSLTLDYCKDLVDTWSLVSEDEIKCALNLIIKHHNILVEGSAALALAALRKNSEHFVGKKVVLILCGDKINHELLREIVSNPQRFPD